MMYNQAVQDALLRKARAVECEEDGLYFARYFFKQRYAAKMIINRHHHVLQAALDRTLLPCGDINRISRLIISVPPGYTKTELAVINYMARGFAINPQSRFLHLTSGQQLALVNSQAAREIVKSAAYQALWPVKTKEDVDSKSIWHTVNGGGVTANAAGAQVTGFRAGHMYRHRFSGALIIDDPIKPDDTRSDLKRTTINERYNETIASRVAIEDVPIIVIMQPLHWNDLTGYLLAGGSGEYWHHLRMPVIIDNKEPYPKEYTHGIPIPHGLKDGWLWPAKHNEDHHTALKAHRKRYWAQYRLKPIKRDEEKALWSEDTIERARHIDHGVTTRTVVAVDPATSNDETSDHHGIVVAEERGKDRYGVIADYTRKGSPSQWAHAAIAAYEKHNADGIIIETNQGGDMCIDTLRNAGFKGQIIEVKASKGKVIRAEPIAALYELGYVGHNGKDLDELEDEMLDFDPLTGKANGSSPNRVDALVWALTYLSGGEVSLEELLEAAINANGG